MRKIACVVLIVLTLVFVQLAQAQLGKGGGPKFYSDFKPVVGGWSEYQMTTKSEGSTKMKIAIVGKEGDAYWYETVMEGGRQGRNIVKMLVSGDPGDTKNVKRMIFKQGNEPAMEKAVRICIDEAVKLIVAKTPKEYYRVAAPSDAQTDSQAASSPPPAVPQRSGASSKSPSSGQPQAVTRSGPSQPSAPASGPEARVVYVKWKTVSLREGPGTNFKSLAEIKKGTALEILEDKGQWIRVRLEDGQEGWIGKATTCETP